MVDHDLHKGTPTEYRLEYREAMDWEGWLLGRIMIGGVWNRPR